MALSDGGTPDEAPGFAGGMRGKLNALRASKGARTALRGGAWSIGGYGVTTALSFISRILLAKLLVDASPMGDVAVVTTIMIGLDMISDLGIGVNIVQHRAGTEPQFLGTAYSVQALRGVVLWALASLLAYPIARLYHDPALAGLLMFGALSALLRGLANPALWTMTRRVDLRGPTLVNLAAALAGFAVTVSWAVVSPSAAAFVAGTVASAATYAIGSHIISPRVRFAWDRRNAGEITRFGGWILLSTGTYFLSSRGETLMLKGVIPAIEFGCFAFAVMLVTTPTSAITQVGSQVFLPMMASWIREEPTRAIRQFRRARWAFTGLSLCVAWGGIVAGPMLIWVLKLGPTYRDLGWMVQALAVRSAHEVYAAPSGNVLLAFGASRYSAAGNAVRLALLGVGLALTVPTWGMTGAIWVLVGAPLLSYAALLPGLHRNMPGALRTEALMGVLFVGGIALAAALSWLLGGAAAWQR